ncbi:MAG: hypothetical protein GQ581_06980 [Methyloprofundus sp.]|nr:hypothetical protein [Methyloprofundus sp.]
MKNNLLNVAMAIGLSTFSVMAHSTAIIDIEIYGTGLDGIGNPLGIGDNDLHYTVNENSGTPAQVLSHPAYFPNNSDSQWIWQNASGTPADVTRTFTTTFELTGLDLSSVEINGAWGTDNQGLDILINGNSTGINLLGVIEDNYQALTDFTINSGFVSGINTLEFIIQDSGGVAAFRTELSGIGITPTAPAPAAIWLVGSGLIGLFGMRKRQQVYQESTPN